MIVSPEWQNVITEVTSAPGVVMVIGGVDTGKTSFCLQLCNASVEAEIPTAIVDADLGQSEVGVPGTVGMALLNEPVDSLSDLKPKRLYFVGATTPAAHVLETVVGTKKLVDAAVEQGARLVVVDTSGLIDGSLGRRLKTYKIDLVCPGYVIGIQKRREIEHLLAPFSKMTSPHICKLQPTEEARRKPPEMRAARRRMNYYKHFSNAERHVIRLDQVSFWNTWFGSGRPMKWQYIKFVEDALKCHVLHAEVTGTGLYIISEKPCRLAGRAALEEEFKTRNIALTTGQSFQNLLVGLADETGRTLDVGLLQAVDFKQKFMSIISPVKTVSPVRVVRFGTVRVSPAGEEMGTIRPGEI